MGDPRNVQDPEQHAQVFLNSFCQDIESPLNVILTGTELLAEAGRRSPGCYTPQQERAIQSIQDSAAVLGRMAENILDAYQCRAGGMTTRRQALELVSHFSQLAELVRPCAARQGVELSFQAQAETLVVMTDRVLADRVVLNLLSNAVYHGGARGHVWIELKPDGAQCRFLVRDDGSGLPAAMVAQLNEDAPAPPPATRGGGLGLYLCREFCLLLGWRMRLQTGPEGTEVELTIPADWMNAGGELHSTPVNALLEADDMRRMVRREFSQP